MLEKNVYVALGSNVGDRNQNIEAAICALDREGVRVLKRSSIYESEPRGILDQPWFLNMVLECETRTFPVQLLGILKRIERQMGRVNKVKGGPREIDLDILLFGQLVMETEELTIPHPRALERRFVLEPLLEIAPNHRHPKTKQPLKTYLQQVGNQLVRRVE